MHGLHTFRRHTELAPTRPPPKARTHHLSNGLQQWRKMCWGPAIDVDAETGFISIVARHPLMETMFPHGCGLFQWDNERRHKAKEG